MTREVKRYPINFRPFLIVALAVAAAVFCAYAYALIRPLGIACFCILAAVCAAAFCIFTVKLLSNKSGLRKVLTCFLSLALSISAFATAAVGIDSWSSEAVGGRREISGRVCAVDVRSGGAKIDIDGVTLDGGNVDGVLRINISASDVNIAESVQCGDRLSLSAFVTAVKPIDGNVPNGTAYRTGIRFYASARSDNIKIEFGKPKPIERFSSALKTLLVGNMGERYGNIAYSMLTGDKHSLDTEITDVFSAAGLGHIMAVSGLHVGFLAALIAFVLCKTRRSIRFAFISVAVAAYCVIADFSPSIVRAAIMTEISAFSLLIGSRRDLLSSLCCSFSLILAVRPFYMFEPGFLMSFGAIFGIAAFAGGFSRALKRVRAGGRLSDALGVSAAVNIGILPSQMYFFHTVQVFSLIVNTVMIPYISVAFVMLLLCSAIGALPFCGAALIVPKYLLMPIDYISRGIAAVPYSTFTVYSTAAAFLCYPVMFCASGFFMSDRAKLPVVLASVAACSALLSIGSAPSRGHITVVDAKSTESVIVDDKTFVIGYMHDGNALFRALQNDRCKKVDAVYLFELSYKTADGLLELYDRMKIGAVYGPRFDLVAERLIENGIDYRLFGEGDGGVTAVTAGGELIGYGYGGVLFAADSADERLFSGYRTVRVNTVEYPADGVTYLCNNADTARDGVLTLDGGEYSYAI